MSEPRVDVRWRVRLTSPPEAVFELLATDAGRERFWVSRSRSAGRAMSLTFPDATQLDCRVLDFEPPGRFALTYFEGNRVEFLLEPRARGTDVTLIEAAAPAENHSGWVSVLLNLKAVADFGVDLRHGDPSAGWSEGHVDA